MSLLTCETSYYSKTAQEKQHNFFFVKERENETENNSLLFFKYKQTKALELEALRFKFSVLTFDRKNARERDNEK